MGHLRSRTARLIVQSPTPVRCPAPRTLGSVPFAFRLRARSTDPGRRSDLGSTLAELHAPRLSRVYARLNRRRRGSRLHFRPRHQLLDSGAEVLSQVPQPWTPDPFEGRAMPVRTHLSRATTPLPTWIASRLDQAKNQSGPRSHQDGPRIAHGQARRGGVRVILPRVRR